MATDQKAIRRYHAGIERALSLFDSTSEWADFIAYLGRLLKALQDPPPGADLPMKTTISHHLAQCLRPSLPSGVHQKALDVYASIFTNIGHEGLASDLSLYLPGLSHTLAFASLSTRPQLLALYDDFILTLEAHILRPALRALVLALLPGLEEETSEDFERTLTTFNRLRTKFIEQQQGEIFWQNLFLASITSPNRRAGVLVYLVRYLPRLAKHQEEQSGGDINFTGENEMLITRPEPGLLVRCFATGLQDDQPLIQRGFLDLLVTHLPLDAHIFSNNRHMKDVDVLVRSAATVVLRRDMGLNRRLWSWFTGSDAKTAPVSVIDTSDEKGLSLSAPPKVEAKTLKYFSTYGSRSLIRALQTMISSNAIPPVARAQPFRIALSLMDRWEIGGPVVEATFIPLVQSLQSYQSSAPSQEAFDEVFRSANVFFDGIEGRLIASQIIKLLELGNLDLIFFLLTNFNFEDDEMMKRHIPMMCLLFTERLCTEVCGNDIRAPGSSDLSVDMLTQILEELVKLVGNGVLIDQDSIIEPDLRQSWQSQLLRFYESGPSASKSIMVPLSKNNVTTILMENLSIAFIHLLGHSDHELGILPRLSSCIDRCFVLSEGFATMGRIHFASQMLQQIEGKSLPARHAFESATSATKVIASLSTQDSSQEILNVDWLCQFVPVLTNHLWGFLQPSTPQYHVEATESIWRLHSISVQLELVESTVSTILTSAATSQVAQKQNVLNFATIWAHSKAGNKQARTSQTAQTLGNGDESIVMLRQPLLFLIDSAGEPQLHNTLALWVRSLNSLGPLFRVVLDAKPDDLADKQLLGLAFARLFTLTTLASTSPPLWESFCKQSGQATAVLEFCSSVISKEAYAETLAVKALSLVQVMLKTGQYKLGNEFLSFLSTQLAATHKNTELQGALLDTLHVALSSVKNAQASEVVLHVIIDCLTTLESDDQIDKLVTLLCTIVPSLATSTLMTNLLKITETICLRLQAIFKMLQDLYSIPNLPVMNGGHDELDFAISPEQSMSTLLSGIEYVLARAHHQVSLASDRTNGPNSSSTDLTGNRSSANDHLTVVLCMQDVLKSCANIWLWRTTGRNASSIADIKSLHYTSSKLRTKSRRILENLVEAEPQECLETLMGLWVAQQLVNNQQGQILDLLQTLDGARPKFMMPATFNAIYNRTNPSALDRSQRSSLSVDVNAFQLIAFLNDYTNALEDDLLDEIWTDCTTFLKEIMANPMPHRQILLKLLEFAAVLCSKMENTNFVEESRMRKELADILARLFTAIFTIKPGGLDGSGSSVAEVEAVFGRNKTTVKKHLESGNALQIFYDTLPDLNLCLTHSDRLISIYTGIGTHMTGPLLHSKTFPLNVSPELLALMQTMTSAPSATKAWKKDISDAFNDSKFFQNSVELVEPGWVPLIRSLALADKALMPELLNRLVPPAAAGLMFGVGAAAARTTADKQTQLTLRRMILVLLSTETDSFIPHLQQLFTKLQELLTATADSSPSSSTRTDIYLTFRAILLCFSQSNLATLWPVLDSELRELCTDMMKQSESKHTIQARVQGAKLLDVLLLLKPDEFQLHEWLFVTDTVDAIYPPNGLAPVALADQIGAATSHTTDYILDAPKTPISNQGGGLRKPWLCTNDSRDPEKFAGLLNNFFSQLSIRAFEGDYSLQKPDIAACRKDLIADLFVEG